MRLLLLPLILLAFISLPVVVTGQTNVINLEGEWYVESNPKQSLYPGFELPPDAIIRTRSPAHKDYIVIHYCAKGAAEKQVIARRCRNVGECDQPIVVPRAAPCPESWWTQLKAAIFDRVRRKPGVASVNAGMTPYDKPSEAVVLRRGERVDLSPVFARMTPRVYSMRLDPLTTDGNPTPSESGRNIELRKPAKKSSPMWLDGVAPGLYELTMLEKVKNEFLPTGLTAWVLVVDSKSFPSKVALFRRASDKLAAWKPEVDQGTIRGYQRQLLAHLAEVQSKN